MRGDIVAFDLETTGLSVSDDSIIEIGAVKMRDGEVIDEYGVLVNPGFVIPDEVTRITGIEQADIRHAPTLAQVLPDFIQFVGNAPVIAHNAAFDVGFMNRFGALKDNFSIDTVSLSSILLPTMPRYSLGSLTAHLGISLENAHRALDDARATGFLYWRLWEKLMGLPYALIQELTEASRPLNWAYLPIFEEILAVRENEQTETFTPLDVFKPLEGDYPAHKVGDDIRPLDLEQVDALFEPDGKLEQTLEHYEAREPQKIMAHSISEAFNSQYHTFIEAGTGTGKSLAYLIPAMLWAEQNEQRVVVSTNTINLQDQLIKKDIPAITNALDSSTRAVTIKGRGNYLCPRRLTAVRRRKPSNLDELQTLAKILIWMQDSDSGDKNEITLRGGEWYIWTRLSAQDEGCTIHRCATQMEGKCPFYKARKKAENAQVVVVNHALLISDAVSDNRVLPDYDYLVVDEAHQIEDAVTHGMSMKVDALTLLRRLTELGGVNRGVLGDLLKSVRDHIPAKQVMRLESFIQTVEDATQAMQAHIRRYFQGIVVFLEDTNSRNSFQVRITERQRHHGSFARIQDTWNQLDEFFDVFIGAMGILDSGFDRLSKYEIPSFDDHVSSVRAVAGFFGDVRQMMHAFTLEPDSNQIYWINVQQNPDFISLQMAPLHVGPLMEEHLWGKKQSIVMTSATLQSSGGFDFMKSRLYADDIDATALGSPFDYKESTLLYIPDDMPAPNAGGYQKMVERAVIEMASALNGRTLVLFTSYSQLRETASKVAPRLLLGGITVYDQATGGSRESLLESFKSTERAVLMGTKSFWEGVDIAGDDLSGLIIVKLPFAVPSDPVFASRSETYGNAFNQFAVPDAILRFRQGFGRLIRTQQDRGVVAVLDSRVINKGYGRFFLDALPDCTVQMGPLSNMGQHAKTWLNL